MCPSESVSAARMSGRSSRIAESVGAYSSMRSSRGSSVPLLPFWTISASLRPVL